MNFNISPKDHDMVLKILKRADDLAVYLHQPLLPRPEILMDIELAHVNGCPLDLEGLLNADVADFAHDVWGIHREIDRTTARLHVFSPRYALANQTA